MRSPSASRILSDQEAIQKLTDMGEEGLLSHYKELNPKEKEVFRRQITQLDIVFFHKLQEELTRTEVSLPPFEPFHDVTPSGSREDRIRGEAAVRKGRCAALVLAGGQGSRLRCSGPKGCVPISNVKQKTLFQLLAERVKAASEQVGRPLEVAIMTSPLNHVETEHYFVRNAFFGLDPQQIHFFYQRMWPFLDFGGHLFLESPGTIATGPNGNGGVFRRLVEVGLWQRWRKQGIEHVNVLSIDNPLALPFDHELFGFQERTQSDVVVKTALRRDPQEKVGVLVTIGGKTHIVEYSELNQEIDAAVANLGLYSFSMPFIKRASEVLLPLHRAKKAVKKIGDKEIPAEPNAWKFEEFIFDVLPLAERCEALLFPRESLFAPLKNYEGEDSIVSVQEALLARDRQVYADLTGEEPAKTAFFELSAPFYYPTENLREKWKGKPLPGQEYIEE